MLPSCGTCPGTSTCSGAAPSRSAPIRLKCEPALFSFLLMCDAWLASVYLNPDEARKPKVRTSAECRVHHDGPPDHPAMHARSNPFKPNLIPADTQKPRAEHKCWVQIFIIMGLLARILTVFPAMAGSLQSQLIHTSSKVQS